MDEHEVDRPGMTEPRQGGGDAGSAELVAQVRRPVRVAGL